MRQPDLPRLLLGMPGGVVSDFVLDRVENPHPRMLNEALALRADARRNTVGPPVFRWDGYLQAMCAATGETPADIEAWMDRNAVPGDRVRPEST